MRILQKPNLREILRKSLRKNLPTSLQTNPQKSLPRTRSQVSRLQKMRHDLSRQWMVNPLLMTDPRLQRRKVHRKHFLVLNKHLTVYDPCRRSVEVRLVITWEWKTQSFSSQTALVRSQTALMRSQTALTRSQIPLMRSQTQQAMPMQSLLMTKPHPLWRKLHPKHFLVLNKHLRVCGPYRRLVEVKLVLTWEWKTQSSSSQIALVRSQKHQEEIQQQAMPSQNLPHPWMINRFSTTDLHPL